MKDFSKKTIKIFWRAAKKYQLAFWTIVLTTALAALAHVIPPIFYRDFFNILSEGEPTNIRTGLLVAILMKIMAVYLIGWLFWRISTFTTTYFQTKVMNDLYNTCFAYIHRHSISFFNNTFIGSLVKKVNRYAKAFMGVTDAFFFEFLQIGINLIFIFIILFINNRIIGLIIFGWVIVYLLVNLLFSFYKLKYDFKKSEVDSEITGYLADTIANHQNVKLFNGYQRERNGFGQVVDRWRRLQLFSWNLTNIFEAVQGILAIGLEIGIFYFAVKLWQRGQFSLGDFVLIQAYVLTIFMRLWNFGRVIRHYFEHMADANEMTEILETPHEIQDVKNAIELKVKQGEIEFKKVNFSYHKTRRIFFNLNLLIEPGERVALVGPSGAGKSTLINLLLRNYDLGGGKIYIDKQKISSVRQNSLHRQISLVPQDPILFHRSLMENIRYGNPSATDEQVMRAAKLAKCHDFISQLSEGYETYVGERGVKLSGGERQRVAIARAILKNAPIIVLDEATSSLDSESEELIQEALRKLMESKTVIVIAHRLSTIMKMDRIIVLENGKIVEEGSHESLLKKKSGLYRRLWTKQAGGFIR
jgi:ATP-binding cassette subfamily B protein